MKRIVSIILLLQICLAVSTLAATSPRLLAHTFRPSRRRRHSHHHSWLTPRSRIMPSSISSHVILNTRGGAIVSDDEDEYSDESDEEDFDFEFEEDFDIVEDDFAEDNTLDRIIAAWKTTPPLTKAYLSASFAATMMGYLTNKNQFPKILTLEWKPTFQKLQLWRPLTSFLNFGPFGLGYVMTAHFVWTYMSTLERLNHHRPYDFWIMILFGCISMVAGYGFFGLEPRFLGHNLSTFLVYIWSRYHEGLEVNMFELFNTRAELLPWFFLAQVRVRGTMHWLLYSCCIQDVSHSVVVHRRRFCWRVKYHYWTF